MILRQLTPLGSTRFTGSSLRRFHSTDQPKVGLGDLVNPMAKVLLIGSLTYYGLVFIWYKLDYPVKSNEMNSELHIRVFSRNS